MTVTLQTFDLIQPEGELSADWFPNIDMTTLITGWLQQATTKAEAAAAATDHNAAAAAWVYHRAYQYIAQRLASSPVRVSTSLDGSQAKEMTKDQREYWIKLSDTKRAEYESYEVVNPPANVALFGRVRGRV